MKRNSELKKAIFQSGFTQKELARIIGIQESHLSMAINGRYVLDDAQKTAIAWALQTHKMEIF